jgi:D-tyrosyl-tRNA(Tyr) deacylase
MRLVIQRTSGVELFVDGKLHNGIGRGLLIFVGTKTGDNESLISKLADKTVNIRIFEDEQGKMNLSPLDIDGDLMVVSQFTLYADMNKGRRPSFNEAQEPIEAERLYNIYIDELKKNNLNVKSGIFGASMDIRFNNDGPVTIIIDNELS